MCVGNSIEANNVSDLESRPTTIPQSGQCRHLRIAPKDRLWAWSQPMTMP